MLSFSGQGLLATDKEGKIFFADSYVCKVLGINEEEVKNRSVADYLGINMNDLKDQCLFYQKPDGKKINIEIQIKEADFPAQKVLLFYIKEKLADMISKEIINNTSYAVMVTDTKGVIEWVNQAFTSISGYYLDDIYGKKADVLKSSIHDDAFYNNMWQTINKGEVWKGEVVNRHKNGSLYTVEQSIRPLKDDDGNIIHFVAHQEDITAKKYAEGRIQELANYDRLTGLHNRESFIELCDDFLQNSLKLKHKGALIAIDLLNFTRINDTFGHNEGDVLLKAVSQKILSVSPPDSLISRFDGDQFAVLCSGLNKTEDAASIAINIINAVLEPIKINNKDTLTIGSCIGIAGFPENGKTAIELINNSEVALHKASRSTPNSYFFLSKGHEFYIEAIVSLEQDLRKAIENQEFILYYQPQIDIHMGRIISFEALVRWVHPTKGLILPSSFIPIAEDTGLIVPLGEWIIKEALGQLKAWLDMGLPDMKMGVNLSAVQFQQKDLAEKIESILNKVKIAARYLDIELTETVIMKDVDLALETLSKLAGIGITISIDDFGTGYSSLNYLKKFPVNCLKVDQSFVNEMASNYDDARISNAIIGLGHSLGLDVVAEGIEKIEQFNILKRQGCDIAQGYLFSKPLPASQVPDFIKKFDIENFFRPQRIKKII